MALLARNEGLLSYLARHGGRKSPLPGNLAKGRIEMHAKIALFAAALVLAAPVSAKPSQAPAASPTPVSFNAIPGMTSAELLLLVLKSKPFTVNSAS